MAPDSKHAAEMQSSRRAEIVLQVINGKLTVKEAAERYDLLETDVRHFVDQFIGGGRAALEQEKRRAQEHAARPRRSGPDVLIRLIEWTAVLAWGLTIVALLLLDSAGPNEFSASYQVYHGRDPARPWRMNLVHISQTMLLLTFVLGTVGLLVNNLRHKRREDRFSRPLIVVTILSALAFGLMAYFLGI
jgi:hypothetical protein